MINEFELSIDNYLDPFIIGDAFKEFALNLDELNGVGSYYSELVVDRHSKLYNDKHSIIKNTSSTIKDTANIYNDLTDANASLIKSSWDLMIKMIRLCTRTIAFITNKISTIPLALSKSIDYISNLPIDIKTKLNGDIQLYITTSDIELIYNQMIIYKLDNFISLGREMSKGDLWGTLFMKKDKTNNLSSSNNDIKLAKQMEKIYNDLASVQFTPNIISLKDNTNIEKYFTNSKSVSFKTLKGDKFEGSYLSALKQLIDDLNNKKSDLEFINKSLGEKYDKTMMNNTFVKLNGFDQKRIIRILRMMSKIVSIVGYMVKHTIHDVNTINSTIKKINKRSKK